MACPALAPLLAAVLAQAPPAAPSPTPAVDKKTAYLAAKGERGAGRPARPGQRAERPIWAHNLRTHEIRALTGSAGLAEGSEDPHAATARRSFFRCWFTHADGPIPPGLVAKIIEAADHFEVREVRIISGFRHPKNNLLLRKKGREVAAKSQHTQANAIDFFLPEVETRALYDWLLATHPGGVGFYPVSEFVHIDFGRKRTWRGT